MSHKKSDKRHSDPANSINQDTDHSIPDRSRAAHLRLVTVAEEQRRLDAQRQNRRAAYQLDRNRRLDSVFGSPPTPRKTPDWN